MQLENIDLLFWLLVRIFFLSKLFRDKKDINK